MGDTEVMGQSREAWSEFADEFADIARRFRENYESLSEAAEGGSEKSRKSVDRAVRSIRKTLGEMGDSLGDTLRDPGVRDETKEAGAALLNAFGRTLADLGQALQRTAEHDDPDAS